MAEIDTGRRKYIQAAAAAIAASIAGCGGDDDASTATEDGSPSSPTDTPTAVGNGSSPSRTATPPADGIEPHEASLLVSPEMYPELRDRQGEDPWDTWAQQARTVAGQELSTGSADGIQEDAKLVHNHASAAALSYILDTEHRDRDATTVKEAIEYYHDSIYPELGGGWNFVVRPAGTYFTAVLALDIVQAHLDGDVVADLESKLGDVGDWYWESRGESWNEARIGAYGIWAAYENDAERLRIAGERALWRMHMHFRSGSYIFGTGYANGRFAGRWRRNSKFHFMDVLEYASDIDVYDVATNGNVNEALEWLFGYSMTPIVNGKDGSRPQRDVYAFGDSVLRDGLSSWSSAAYRGGKFGDAVENNAAWALVGENPEAAGLDSGSGPPGAVDRLIAYLLTESVPSDPDPIPSRVFEESATFHADSQDPETLAATLWNVRGIARSHTHPETNAIHCCAYGEHVLRNAGYNQWQQGASGFSWEYINERAVANNVALVDYEIGDPQDPNPGGHARKTGGGVLQGFIDDPGPVAWAAGHSGPALSDGTHLRNFVFVPGTDDANGYWLLLDAIKALDADTVHTVLHPNSAEEPTADGDGIGYTVPVGRQNPRSENDVDLTVAYGTEPDAVDTHNGVLAATGETFVGQYLYTTYPASADGLTGVVTALFPHDGAHEKAEFTRTEGTNGLEIAQGSVTDHVAYHGGEFETIGPASVAGEFALIREGGTGPEFEYVRNATRYRRGDRTISADDPVTITIQGKRGNLAVSTETSINVGYPGIDHVRLDGQVVSMAPARNDFVDFTVTPGVYELELVTA